MPSDPDFSVLIPTRNRPALLARALASALAQRGASFEVLVADDGDGEGLAAAAAGGPNVRAFATGQVGQVPARNQAAAQARGRWIAFLDDDDWWAGPNHLAALAAELEQGCGLAFASGRLVRKDTGESLRFAARADAASLRRNNELLVSGIAFETALWRRLGPFDESLSIYWDWDWYLRLAAAGVRFCGTAGEAVRISVRPGTESSPENTAVRQAELARLCARHGLTGIALKNHESLAVEQREARP